MNLKSLTIQGGFDKNGKEEKLTLHVKVGEIISMVGPTGSGKSRLLEDIEWMAQGDTPTGRRVLVDGAANSDALDGFGVSSLVAQLSQHMNFIMDITVAEFISMHGESRMLETGNGLVKMVVQQANFLCGEKITAEMPLAALSGGQSRALMIADTAALSAAPIVLIDEIENAGINRKTALELLIKHDKLVFIATHDPLLALLGHKRLVMKNGGMAGLIEKTKKEEGVLQELQKMDERINVVRQALREGKAL